MVRFGRIVLIVALLTTGACGDDSSDDSGASGETVTSTGSGGGSTTPDDGGTTTAAGVPDTDDAEATAYDTEATFRHATNLLHAHLDPHKWGGTLFLQLSLPIYDRLTQTDENLVVQPMLAESWEFSADGLTLTMNLRDDVTFHDGTPFNAEAVAPSIERAKTVEGSTVAANFAVVESIDVVSEFVVAFHLARPDVSFPAVLSLPTGAIINPNLIDSPDLALKPPPGIGTGPYTVEEFVPSERITFSRVDDYWDQEAIKFAPKTFIASSIPEAATRISALQSGEVDSTTGINLNNDMVELGESDGFQVVYHDFFTMSVIAMRNTAPPYNEPLVRQAIVSAIDGDTIVGTALAGEMSPQNQLWGDAHWAHDDDFAPPFPYDPERAKELLTEAGHPDGIDIEIYFPPGNPGALYGPAAQAQLATVGIRATLTPIEGGLINTEFIAGNLPAITGSISSGFPDPQLMINNIILGGWNLAGEEDDAVRAIAESATDPTLSETERAELYADFNVAVAEEAWYAPIGKLDAIIGAREGVEFLPQANYVECGHCVNPLYVRVLAE